MIVNNLFKINIAGKLVIMINSKSIMFWKD